MINTRENICGIQNMFVENLKIFAFFGADFDGNPDSFLQSLYNEGYTFLALDPPAIELLSRTNLPYTIIHDWLKRTDILEIIDIAWDCEVNWFHQFREDFTMNDICWPEIDHMVMHWFWLDVVLSDRLVKSFQKENIKTFLIIEQKETNIVICDWKGSICKEVWKSELSECIKIINRENIENPIQINQAKSIYSDFNQYIYSSPEILKGKIAYFIASDVELTRSNDILQDLITNFSNEIVLIPNCEFFVPERDICKIMNRWKVPIIEPIKYFDENNERILNKFKEAYVKIIKSSDNTICLKYLKITQYYITFFIRNRWPKLNKGLGDYYNLFLYNKPKLLINSSLNHAEWLLPVLAANRLSIPTVSMPHSVYHDTTNRIVPTNIIYEYNYYLSNNLFSRDLLKKNLQCYERTIILCKNCVDKNAYLTKDIPPLIGKRKLSILVILNPIQTKPGRLIFTNRNARMQINAISDLIEISNIFSNDIEILFKVHPGFPELELLHSAAEESKITIFPVNSGLEQILREVNVVIGINYYGSGIINTLINNLPFINYVNDELYEFSYRKMSAAPEMFDEGIFTIRSCTELKEFIGETISNPSVLEQTILNEQKFTAKYLNNSNFPTISMIIDDILKIN